MATLIRTQVTLVNDTGVPRDVATNTWHFWTTASGESGIATQAGACHAALEVFYNAIGNYLSDSLSDVIHMKSYDLTDLEPRSPILTSTGTIDPLGETGQGLPNEVAICLSYHADVGSGVNVRRRRGRLYLGPLDLGVLATRSGDAQILAGARDDIADAAVQIWDSLALFDSVWSVFSPTTAGAPPWDVGTLDSSSFPVVAGYIDDAFDTIRSRGVEAGDRTTWTAP